MSLLGFGRRVTWTSDLAVPAGHQMTFKDALHVSSTSLILKIVLPSWTMKLTEHTRKADRAINELKVSHPNYACVVSSLADRSDSNIW